MGLASQSYYRCPGQNPSIIDPSRIAVTGCSRFGKEHSLQEVLDNRIALTIPVESGIGGTVGLRLVEQLDTQESGHITQSYVRWFSEVALGKFTSGNNAGADNTDRLPVDMHSAMALIAPRGLYIVDNPSGTYAIRRKIGMGNCKYRQKDLRSTRSW